MAKFCSGHRKNPRLDPRLAFTHHMCSAMIYSSLDTSPAYARCQQVLPTSYSWQAWSWNSQFDIWYRSAQMQWQSCMVGQSLAWPKEEEVADTGTQISCTGWVLLSRTTIWHKSGRRDEHPSTLDNMAGRRDSGGPWQRQVSSLCCREGQHFSEGDSENRHEWINRG